MKKHVVRKDKLNQDAPNVWEFSEEDMTPAPPSLIPVRVDTTTWLKRQTAPGERPSAGVATKQKRATKRESVLLPSLGPQSLVRIAEALNDPAWLWEREYDGFRALARPGMNVQSGR